MNEEAQRLPGLDADSHSWGSAGTRMPIHLSIVQQWVNAYVVRIAHHLDVDAVRIDSPTRKLRLIVGIISRNADFSISSHIAPLQGRLGPQNI
ncbi:hypothetical protein [Pseudomonas cavernae]|uniref:hypothetical protein n=1 Tax=Pseudomonas cavernae TaxID=2320867 RepID=UPI0013C44DC9|nr:hypothetical protein [Pseudomonas cavernae]